MRVARVILSLTATLAVAACGSPAPSGGAAVSRPAAEPELGFGHVHGVDLNPADNLVYAATHHGVFRLGPDGLQRIADRYQDTMAFTITGPDRFLASGHPDPREPGPVHLGLIESTDRAQTWTTVALPGEADFHSLTVAGTTIHGLDSTEGVVLRSDDDGLNWQHGATLAAADLAVDPASPLRVLATTRDGLLESTDGGLTFSSSSASPPRPLVLIDHVEKTGSGAELLLAGVDAEGGVWTLSGEGWSQSGTLPGAPQAFTVPEAERYVAATEQGVFASEDAGRTWMLVASTDG
jgi:hypothetical protein